MTDQNQERVRWEELLPDEFWARQKKCPIVYQPLGLCEPHGHIAPFGLDTLKAEFLCNQAAQRFGGIVAPTQGYHIHESGFHAPWLEEVMGETNAHMTSFPPQVMAYQFLYQLRAFANAGFKAALVASGHSGGSQNDLRSVAAIFSKATGMPVIMRSDPEWVEGQYPGDHAGKYEISQLLYTHPHLIDMERIGRKDEKDSGGRFALGEDAAEATPEHGKLIMEAILKGIGEDVEELKQLSEDFEPCSALDYKQTEAIWSEVQSSVDTWVSATPYPDQKPVSEGSRWKPYERI